MDETSITFFQWLERNYGFVKQLFPSAADIRLYVGWGGGKFFTKNIFEASKGPDESDGGRP